MQSDLFAPALPEGMAYKPDFLSLDEEQNLGARIAALSLKPFEFQGFVGRRRTHSFGLHYAFDGSGLRAADPFPDWLIPVRDHAADLAGLPSEALVHALLIEYALGAGIGWHRDRPVFSDVIGISLCAPAPLRFRRKVGAKWERITVTAEPRSAYVLRGPAREEWEHSIPPVDSLRHSITFRSLKGEKP
ncbi:alpha-ketoglutarate-dependent dioxygenase AlkB [Allosphingosinicella vermicomposti]|uniref:alpha-ketoglutarate-dependent dioxygenase AlkB n=1 Tax=Allosphingosinicella vermicomposti TaxID=614671 RepID=UPI000D113C6C|nr:alpha-ketoglutarate-dependent dioxygenase AlkB [Allosphingosinicella vermicomposti]